jgi:hypothetical protein
MNFDDRAELQNNIRILASYDPAALDALAAQAATLATKARGTGTAAMSGALGVTSGAKPSSEKHVAVFCSRSQNETAAATQQIEAIQNSRANDATVQLAHMKADADATIPQIPIAKLALLKALVGEDPILIVQRWRLLQGQGGR